MATPPPQTMFAVRIVSCDHYMATPQPNFDVLFSEGQPVLSVPILRIFGSTPAGQHCCLHLHKCFPYFFVPYPEDRSLEWEKIREYIKQLSASIEHAMSLPRGAAQIPHPTQPKQHRHVFKISVVNGRPFYGFSCEKVFLKIYIYDPRFTASIANLLRSGVLMEGTQFQPHEAHLPFTLQMFVDKNLFGMGLIFLKNVSFRCVPNSTQQQHSNTSQENIQAEQSLQQVDLDARNLRYKTWTSENTTNLSQLQRTTLCELEVDASAEDVLNVGELEQAISDGKRSVISLESLWEEERIRKSSDKKSEQENQQPTQQQQIPRTLPPPSESEKMARERIHQIVLKEAQQLPQDATTNASPLVASPEVAAIPPSNRMFKPSVQEISDIRRSKPTESNATTNNGEPESYDDASKTLPSVDTAKLTNLANTDIEAADALAWLRDQSLDLSSGDEEEYSQQFTQKEEEDIISSAEQPQQLDQAKKKKPSSDDDSDDGNAGNDDIPQFDGPVGEKKQRHHHHHHHHGHNKRRRSVPDPIETIDSDDNLSNRTHSKRRGHIQKLEIHSTKKQQQQPQITTSSKKKTRATTTGEEIVDITTPPLRPFPPKPTPMNPLPKVVVLVPETPVKPAPTNSTTTTKTTTTTTSTTPNVERFSSQIIIPETMNPYVLVPETLVPISPPQRQKQQSTTHIPLSPCDFCGVPETGQPTNSIQFTSASMQQRNHSHHSGGEKEEGNHYSPIPWVQALSSASQVSSIPPSLPLLSGATPTQPTQQIRVLIPKQDPPTEEQIIESLAALGPNRIPAIKEPFFSNPGDSVLNRTVKEQQQRRRAVVPGNTMREFTPSVPPPTITRVLQTLPKQKDPDQKMRQPKEEQQQGEFFSWAPEVKKKTEESLNTIVQMVSDRTQGIDLLSTGSSWNHNQHLTLVNIEIHVNTRGKLNPNPQFDSIIAICLCIKDDDALEREKDSYTDKLELLILDQKGTLKPHSLGLPCSVLLFKDEISLLAAFVKRILELDPDILSGFEVQASSLGYITSRAKTLGIQMCQELSRILKISATDDDESGCSIGFGKENDEWGYLHASGIHIPGRIVLNIWRILRSEVKSTMYTLSSLASSILGLRVANLSFEASTKLWCSGKQVSVLENLIQRANLPILFLDAFNVIGRTSELARLFGIDFFSVLSRGSQFRVESMLFRLTKQHNYILLSPSKQQVQQQRKPECLPLVLEPKSQFFSSPVVVLDFQSLYPSIIIAYNYCYSTCLGSVPNRGDYASETRQLGCSSISVPKGLLGFLEGKITISPNGVMFVKPEARVGVLPQMLKEILETRVMIKSALKSCKGRNRALERMLDSRQFGLKMIANVTYGYTAASESGRMPCIELADAIIETARQTLERAIRMINDTPEWNAQVVYGDTDSMFVNLPGRTLEEAMKIGQIMADSVTATNPDPVKLQFEKVYMPSILVSKKRYVGMKHETHPSKKPDLESKGIETVRRDSCPLVQKILDSSLRIVFNTSDLSSLRTFLERSWERINHAAMAAMSVNDFLFAKEVRIGTYANGSHAPPAAQVCLSRMRLDPCAEPRFGERIPYIVVSGGPKSRLLDLVVSPNTFLESSGTMHVNANYYITKQVNPPLQRLFHLIEGVDVEKWYNSYILTRRTPLVLVAPPPLPPGKQPKTLDQFYRSVSCLLCKELVQKPELGCLCSSCAKQPSAAFCLLRTKIAILEQRIFALDESCRKCSGSRLTAEGCITFECPILFSKISLRRSLVSLTESLKQAGALL